MTAIEQSNRLAEDARQAQHLFDSSIRPHLQPEDDGKFVAVDLQTGEYEIDVDDFQATERLLARVPAARIWLLRAGQATTYRIGRQLIGAAE